MLSLNKLLVARALMIALLLAGGPLLSSSGRTSQGFTGYGWPKWASFATCAGCAVGGIVIASGGLTAIAIAALRPGSAGVVAGCVAACVDATN